MLPDKDRDGHKSQSSIRQNSYLCDGGCPKNGTHHATHYNIRVYDLQRKRMIVSQTYYNGPNCALTAELRSILAACEKCHKFATIYNDSTSAISFVIDGVPEGKSNFIEYKEIVEKIRNLMNSKELKLLWWDNKKEHNYADCKNDFKEEKRSSWKRRYKN